jgi:hypothetical protein
MHVLAQSRPAHAPIPIPSPNLIYDLRLPGPASVGFYADVARFSDQLLAEIELRAMAEVLGYSDFVRTALNEVPRSIGEYAIEFLTLGLLCDRYLYAAESSPTWALVPARGLCRLRHKSPRMKPLVDFLRAALIRAFFMPHIARQPLPCPNSESCRRANPCRHSRRGQRLCSRFENALTPPQSPPRALSQAEYAHRMLDGLPRLIEWLHATGEFAQEAMRLDNWRRYLHSLPPPQAIQCVQTAIGLFEWFRSEADLALGAYTVGVCGFLATEYAHRPCREDQLLCGKEPVEYHLGMVAAEIMNRGLRADFESTPRKVVLIPACMRGPYATFCRARISGPDMQCAACSPGCAVNRLTRHMGALGTKVFLVPHATGFSRWLERWQREPDTGVAAVACLLNILPGGYEMRARGIASQCVPLDFPGCQKHWRKDEISTTFNQAQLAQILASPQC